MQGCAIVTGQYHEHPWRRGTEPLGPADSDDAWLSPLQGALENHCNHSLELSSGPLWQSKVLDKCLMAFDHKKILACSSVEQKDITIH